MTMKSFMARPPEDEICRTAARSSTPHHWLPFESFCRDPFADEQGIRDELEGSAIHVAFPAVEQLRETRIDLFVLRHRLRHHLGAVEAELGTAIGQHERSTLARLDRDGPGLI